MICHLCDEYRFPSIHHIRSSNSSRQPASVKVNARKKDVQNGHIIPMLASEFGLSAVGHDVALDVVVSQSPSLETVTSVLSSEFIKS